jgi:hypothetical protein
MTPEEEAYEEALRRIREVQETGALELDLRGSKWDASALEFTGLQKLSLSWPASPRSRRSTSPGARSSAIFPRWPASPRSDRSNSERSSGSAIFPRWPDDIAPHLRHLHPFKSSLSESAQPG